jgi:hypothetical protein
MNSSEERQSGQAQTRSAIGLLAASKDEARRIAANVTKLPELSPQNQSGTSEGVRSW